ncbi:hypothetical protein [Burkholderia cenocepacia]|nr:hypothetical protein [Burkholderia cenocepacia]
MVTIAIVIGNTRMPMWTPGSISRQVRDAGWPGGWSTDGNALSW